MMGKIKTHPFDPAEYLASEGAQAEYLTAALETGNTAFIADAIGIIARAKGMAEVAKQTGLGRESLYKALSAEGNPEFATILKVIRALGLKLTAEPV